MEVFLVLLFYVASTEGVKQVLGNICVYSWINNMDDGILILSGVINPVEEGKLLGQGWSCWSHRHERQVVPRFQRGLAELGGVKDDHLIGWR